MKKKSEFKEEKEEVVTTSEQTITKTISDDIVLNLLITLKSKVSEKILSKDEIIQEINMMISYLDGGK